MRVLRPLTLLLLVGVACAGADGVAARVGDAEVTKDALFAELDAIAANPAYVGFVERKHGPLRATDGGWQPAFVADVLTRQIHDVFVRSEAADADIEPDTEQLALAKELTSDEVGGRAILNGFDATYRTLLIERNAYLGALKAAALEGQSARSFYRSNRHEFVRVCARHIVVSSWGDAERVRGSIARGVLFERVAHEQSLDEGTSPKGGDLGCNRPEDLVPELANAAMSQELGEVGPPIASAAGWQILEVTNRAAPPFEDVRGEVSSAMSQAAEQRVGEALQRRLRRSEVTVAAAHGRWDEDKRKVIV